jgi:hypothetical protein
MSDTPTTAFPIEVTLPSGIYSLLSAEGDPSGVRVRLPDGGVTSLHAHGGTLDHLAPADMATLLDAEPIDV